MATPTRPSASGLVRTLRKVYNPLGFSKGYNALLWSLTDLALLGFVLAKLQFLSFNDVFCKPDSNGVSHAAPGECYWYRTYRRNYYGVVIHLATILPASFLAVFQFIPVIRHKALLYHRIAGYIILLLVLLSQASALMMANHAFGGDYGVRGFVGLLTLATTAALALAYYNIKKLQIDQHRAWMLRAWAWFATIVTLRIISIIAVQINGIWQGDATTYVAFPCAELLSLYNGNATKLAANYPACDPNNLHSFASDGYVAVKANSKGSDATELAAAFDGLFGMSGWIAWAIHAFLVELYLKLTPRETERLRQVSYERQLERGWTDAGRSGLVVDRFGDADAWVPETKARLGSGDTMSAASRDNHAVS